jgi:hypothetical protein
MKEENEKAMNGRPGSPEVGAEAGEKKIGKR